MNQPALTFTARQDAVIPKDFKERSEQKILKVTKLDPSLIQVNIVLELNNNPAREPESHKVEITAQGSGHIARAESRADSYETALDDALEKLYRSMRKVKERRTISKSGHRAPTPLHDIAAKKVSLLNHERNGDSELGEVDPYEDEVDFHEPGKIVRVKEFDIEILDPEEALGKMEAINHDFYLFVNAETSLPCVVYRRRGFDYGLITFKKSE